MWYGWGESRLVAHDAVRSAAQAHKAILGADDFVRKCKSLGAYERALVPPVFVDSLVSANVDSLRLNTFSAAVAMTLGFRIRASDPDKAIRGSALRAVYRALNADMPWHMQPLPVTPIVKAALRAGLGHPGKWSDAKALKELTRQELLLSVPGILTLPGVRSVLKKLTYAISGLLIVCALGRYAYKPVLKVVLLGTALLTTAACLIIAIAVYARRFSAYDWAHARRTLFAALPLAAVSGMYAIRSHPLIVQS